MKKILLLAVAAIMAAGASMAQTPSADEVRIYINPGHGSWGPNDRPMATIPYPNLANGMPDTCGFYESNTNLWKCLKMWEVLQNMGVKQENLMMSRVKNGPYPYTTSNYDPDEEFNRPLSEIAREVDANNMDMFISVHSNAHVDGYTTNYPAIFYSGYDQGKSADDYDFFNSSVGELPGFTGPRLPESYDMAQAMWGPHYMDEIDPNSYYSRTNPCIRGDISFWGGEYYNTVTAKGNKNYGYYGVLRQSTPGFLIEGYFHTYQPARHRALNMDYCHQEGVRIARGICAYFGLNPEPTGYIMGTVKDVHEKIVNNLYNYSPGSIDQWMPLNGAQVELLKDGQVVNTYQVDQNYNGVFVFENLEPGNYQLRASLDGFKEQGTYTDGSITADCKADVEASLGNFVVKANETTYARLYLESETYEPPTVTYYNYPDPEQPDYASVADEYLFEKESKDYEMAGEVRRAVVRGDNIVVLTEEGREPHLYLIDGKAKQLVKELSLNGIAPDEPNNAGFRYRLSDIAFTADNKLIGVNHTLCQINNDYIFEGEQRGTLRFYKWDDLDSDPIEWTTTQLSANWYRGVMGRTLAVSGPSTECTLVTTGTTAYTSTATRLFLVSMSNDQQTGTLFTEYNLNAEKLLSENKTGVNQQLMVSPLADDRYVMDGERTNPYELKPANASNIDAEITGIVPDANLGVEANGVGFFKYAGRALMVSPFITDGKVGGVKLYDVTDGLSAATLINTLGTELDVPVGGDAVPYMAAGATVDGLDITIYLIVDNNITRFTTQGVQQPVVKGIYAYGLSCTPGDEEYTFNFTANSNAESAKIIFTDLNTGEVLGEVELNDVIEGENTVTLSYDEIPGDLFQPMNWAVNLVGKKITNIVRLNDYESGDFTYGSQITNVVDNSPESDYFGRIYVANRISQPNDDNGLWAYNPDWTRINSTRYKGNLEMMSSPYRLGIDSEGFVYIPDWSDPNSGIYVVDPSNLDGDFTQFFLGNRNGDGLFVNNGVNVGGSSTGVWIEGTGADTKLIAASEDLVVNGAYNNVAVYDIGQPDGSIAHNWGEAPNAVYYVGNKLLNGNISVVGDGRGGFWATQLRYTPNNTVGVPSLIHVTEAGNIDFNSGNEPFNTQIDGSNNGGLAITRDGKMLVINDDHGDLQFFGLTWDENGVPQLEHKFSYTTDCQNGRAIYQINFDYAGNMICSGSKLGIYSIPTDDNQTTTPAKMEDVVVKVEAPKFYVSGTFNNWDTEDPILFVDNVANIDLEDNGEFMLLTKEDGDWVWIGAQPETDDQTYFLIEEEMMQEEYFLSLVAESDCKFRIGEAGNFTLELRELQLDTPAKAAAKGEPRPYKFLALNVTRNSFTGVADLNSDNVASVRYVNVSGMVSDQPFDGVNIVVIKYNDGTTKTVKIVK